MPIINPSVNTSISTPLPGYNANEAALKALLTGYQSGSDQANRLTQMTKQEQLEEALKQKEANLSSQAQQNTINRVQQLKSIFGSRTPVDVNGVSIGSAPLAPGQMAEDESFGKALADYQAEGGSAAANRSLDLLNSAKKVLENPATQPSTASRVLSSIPIQAIRDPLRSFFTPESVSAENQVKSAMLDSLKKITGGRVSNQEMQNIMESSYDPKVSPDENLRRIGSLSQGLGARKNAFDQSAQYFKQHGTLQGMPAPTQPQAPAIKTFNPKDPSTWSQ